ncbi:unnamed protein product, partial [marine sediment metagenome]
QYVTTGQMPKMQEHAQVHVPESSKNNKNPYA